MGGRCGAYAPQGSSPLARGLHWVAGPFLCRVGIIPARAGFTAGVSSVIAWRTDHPRSRGVYLGGGCEHGRTEGSSPLARGLPGARSPTEKSVGIIPARAGFTRRAVRRGRHRRDHPRSRGVYGDPHMIAWATGGSSPLARGLHRRLPLWALALGIIPARAGFTSSRGAARCASRDHPRSRGVYVGAARVLGELDGIIPARAGFTTPATCRGPCTWDHPRSRGVYSVGS